MEIFLAPKVAAKRAPTFQINVAVTNFAPKRLVSDKRRSAADKCIRIETYTWLSRQLRYRGRKTKPSNDKHKEKRKWVWFRDGQARRSQGVIALLGGTVTDFLPFRRENAPGL